MGRLIGKSNERILCKLSKRVILRLYSIVDVAMATTKTSNFTCQSKSYIIMFSLATCQLVRCNLSLAMIWQMTYTQNLPKLCSSTWSQFSRWMSHLEGFPSAFPRQHLTTSIVFSCTVVACITGFSFAFFGREKASAKQNFNYNLNFIHSITHPIYNFMIASIRV